MTSTPEVGDKHGSGAPGIQSTGNSDPPAMGEGPLGAASRIPPHAMAAAAASGIQMPAGADDPDDGQTTQTFGLTDSASLSGISPH